MKTSRLDEAILTAAGKQWAKVAMVIARVAKAVESDLSEGDERCDLISVGAGRLMARGNTNDGRASEVRRVIDHEVRES